MTLITTTPVSDTITVTWRGHVVARSAQAVELREGSYPPVLYIPRADADMQYFTRTERHSTCPHKGEASYFSLVSGATTDANAVWTYETPKPVAAAIAGHLAFYPDKVTITRG